MHAKPCGDHTVFRDRRDKLQLMLRRIRRNDETHAGRAEVVTPALLAASAEHAFVERARCGSVLDRDGERANAGRAVTMGPHARDSLVARRYVADEEWHRTGRGWLCHREHPFQHVA